MSMFHLRKKLDPFPPNIQLHRQAHRRLLRITLAWIAGITLLFPLLGCADLRSASQAGAQQISRGRLIWSDEFNGPAGAPPNPSKWTPEIGGHGWGNKQLEYNTNNRKTYQDGYGNLVIEARKGNPAGYQCWYGPCHYTSARLTTNGHFSFTYGLIEASIKLPRGQGIWPAFWLLGSNCDAAGWPACGEIDVMENFGSKPNTIYGSTHGPGHFSSSAVQNPYTLPYGTFADGFHNFAMQWSPDSLAFFVDGNRYATVSKASFSNPKEWVYDHPFDIILNLAIGGEGPGNPSSTTVFPRKLEVAYVRVYQS